MDNNIENVGANLFKTNQELESTKNLILNAMVDYYGEENRDNIFNVLRSINVHVYSNVSELLSILKYEGYSDFALNNRTYYDWIKDSGKYENREFIVIDKSLCDTKEKLVYSLTEAYIRAFMSYNTLSCLNGITRKRGNVYMSYKYESSTDLYNPISGPVFFENACSKCDACLITQNIFKTNKDDFVLYYNDELSYDNVERIKPLMDNRETRNIINYARINHNYLNKLPDQNFDNVQSIINFAIPNIISDKRIYNKNSSEIKNLDMELDQLIEKLNYQYPSQEKSSSKN